MTVHVFEVCSTRAGDEQGMSADRLEGTDRAIHASGKNSRRGREECFRTRISRPFATEHKSFIIAAGD
jgi:hypothetical protein